MKSRSIVSNTTEVSGERLTNFSSIYVHHSVYFAFAAQTGSKEGFGEPHLTSELRCGAERAQLHVKYRQDLLRAVV